MRVLVSFEERHRVYGEALASVIAARRPRVEVLHCELNRLGEQIEELDPYMVVCSEPNTSDPGGRPAWIELSVEAEENSRLCVAGDYEEAVNPDLSLVLSVIDRAEYLFANGRRAEGC